MEGKGGVEVEGTLADVYRYGWIVFFYSRESLSFGFACGFTSR